MAETLETIGTKLDALGAKLDVFSTSVDKRFEQVDKRFEQVDKRFEQVDKRFEQVDKRFDELKSELATRIEAVDAKVDLVVEGFGNLLKKDASNSASHARFEARVDNHELRLVALERERQK
jgi:chaperonin cofactor prefoldin